jgi:hypothetical protein
MVTVSGARANLPGGGAVRKAPAGVLWTIIRTRLTLGRQRRPRAPVAEGG